MWGVAEAESGHVVCMELYRVLYTYNVLCICLSFKTITAGRHCPGLLRRGHIHVVKLRLDRCDVDVDSRDMFGRTPAFLGGRERFLLCCQASFR